MSKNWPAGESRSSRRYREFRQTVLERDGHRCQLRLTGCTVVADQVHHTGARRITGDDPATAVAACRHCNVSTGDPAQGDPAPAVGTWW